MRKVVFVYFNSFYFPSIYGEATYLCFSIKYLLNTGLNHFIPRQLKNSDFIRSCKNGSGKVKRITDLFCFLVWGSGLEVKILLVLGDSS